MKPAVHGTQAGRKIIIYNKPFLCLLPVTLGDHSSISSDSFEAYPAILATATSENSCHNLKGT